jgi:hypothetical protein
MQAFLILLGFWIGSSSIVGILARKRDRNPWGWGVLAFFISPLLAGGFVLALGQAVKSSLQWQWPIARRPLTPADEVEAAEIAKIAEGLLDWRPTPTTVRPKFTNNAVIAKTVARTVDAPRPAKPQPELKPKPRPKPPSKPEPEPQPESESPWPYHDVGTPQQPTYRRIASKLPPYSAARWDGASIDET